MEAGGVMPAKVPAAKTLPAKRSPAARSGATSVETLQRMLDYAFDRASWHGSNLMGCLHGVTIEQALRKPAGRRCIWEQLLHAAYWKHRIVTKLSGKARFPRRGSNWPRLPDPADRNAWRADMQLLRDTQGQLKRAVSELGAQRIDEKTERMIIGAALHDIYHTGQIKLLKRMLSK